MMRSSDTGACIWLLHGKTRQRREQFNNISSAVARSWSRTPNPDNLTLDVLPMTELAFGTLKAAVCIPYATDKDFEDFNGQVTDTIAFLTTNRVQLVELKNAIPDISWEIDYGYNTKVATGELAVEGLHLPVEFLKLCSELKIEILVSLYDGKLFG